MKICHEDACAELIISIIEYVAIDLFICRKWNKLLLFILFHSYTVVNENGTSLHPPLPTHTQY